MVNNPPRNWKYSEEIEMLFFFYQCVDELLSENTGDTYALPVHNSMTLVHEIEFIYNMLMEYDLVSEYYLKYIPVIIDELIFNIEDDHLLKREFGKRLDTIKTGFREAKNNHVLLRRWLSIFHQACSDERYIQLYKDEIGRLILSTINKSELVKCARRLFVCLVNDGLSREFLYTLTRKFFLYGEIISSNGQIMDYLKVLSEDSKEVRFLILMDTNTIEYVGKISNSIRFENLIKIDVDKERDAITSDPLGSALLLEFDRRVANRRDYQIISIVRYTAKTVDPYRTIESLEDNMMFLQCFSSYYKHFYPIKQIFKVLVENESKQFIELQIPEKLTNRPFVTQEAINTRISNIFKGNGLSQIAFNTLASAFEMHAQALESSNETVMLRNFWTSLETLFSNPIVGEVRESVIQSVLCIIQKTYILKILRTIHHQISEAIDEKSLIQLHIKEFTEFLEFFSEFDENSEGMKTIFSRLASNPLLRSRIYEIRRCLGNGKRIKDMLANHYEKIDWQLKRIYRARNIATHIGQSMPNTQQLVNNLHAYFDYIVNYIVCKIENNDYVSNIASLVFEAKNDNMIHSTILQENQALNRDNHLLYLFGPDIKLEKYTFEY